MMSTLQENMKVIIAVGVGGVVVGAVATVAIQQLVSSIDNKLSGVADKMERLEREMSQLKHQLEYQQAAGERSQLLTNRLHYPRIETCEQEEEEDDDEEFQEAEEGPFITLRPTSAATLTASSAVTDAATLTSSRSTQAATPTAARSTQAVTPTPGQDADTLRPGSPISSDDEYVSLSSGSGTVPPRFSTSQQLFAVVDRLSDGTDAEKEEAFNIMSATQGKYPNDPEFLWRYSKAAFMSSQIAGSRGDTEQQKGLVYKSNNVAAQALHLSAENSCAHKWYAITLGSLGDYEGLKVKILNGYKFKEHIEKSIELNPADPSSHYLLGRWCYGVYMLSWMERKVAATLFAAPPSATIDEALTHFEKAQELQTSPWKENMLYLAKCFIEKSNYKAAASWLDQADRLPCKNSEEEAIQVEVSTLLGQYRSYL